MEYKYLDSHSHLYLSQFDEDREEVLVRMKEQGVATIAVGVDLKTSKKAIELAQKHDVVLGATIGIHPNDASNMSDASLIFELAKEEGVVGIGECGFDYYRTPREEVYVRQREVFEAQVVFAAENDVPLMLHVRPSEGSTNAHDDTLEILRLYQKEHGDTVRGNVHFFTSTKEIARAYLEIGFTIAFPGVVTFAPELESVVRDVPLDMMLSETDAPYASPVPHRGVRNEPVFVKDTIAHIAHIRGEEEEVVRDTLTKNAERLFLSHD